MSGPRSAHPGGALPPARGVSAIVLAGGRSSRFGGPKLAAEIEGVTLLGRALDAVVAVAEDVVIAGPALPDPALPPAATGSARRSMRIVRDAEPFAGPLAALAGALRATTTDLAIVVGADMPGLVPEVLGLMLARLESSPDIDAVHLAGATPSLHRQVLPLALRAAAATTAAAEAVDAGERSLVRLVERLRTVEIPASEWLAIDPAGRTLLDVDEPADLERWHGAEIR